MPYVNGRATFFLVLLCILFPMLSPIEAQETEDVARLFWDAASTGDVATIERLLEAGVEVDLSNSYGASPLMLACARGQLDAVKLLLDSGADPNHRDRFYRATPMAWAAMGNTPEIAVMLVEKGSTETWTALQLATRSGNIEALTALRETGKLDDKLMSRGSALVADDAKDALKAFYEGYEPPPKQADNSIASWEPSEKEIQSLLGTYRTAQKDEVKVDRAEDAITLRITSNSGPEQTATLTPSQKNQFQFGESSIRFSMEREEAIALTVVREVDGKSESTTYDRIYEKADRIFSASSKQAMAADLSISSPNWMQFRGNGARGIAEGQNPPETWDSEGKNLAWKTAIPGLGNSSPIVVGDKIFVTTAIGGEESNSIKTGLYGDVNSVEDDSVHRFVVYCLSRATGGILWERTANEAVPKVKRHLKSTHANPTPASDGNVVVAFFGSEGLYCFDMDGELIWQRDLGLLDSGWFFDASYQWGFASSPVIHGNQVFIQCDIQENSFVAALDLETGDELWRRERDEIPSWSTPTVVKTSAGELLVTNATKFARAYRPADGSEVWRIGANSEIAVPTPFTAHDMIFVSSGYRPIQPIYAIAADAKGDLTLPKGESSSDSIEWSMQKGGPYMPTPICYGDFLYTCSNSGILTCYEAVTGKRVYKKRLSGRNNNSFVGSPVAADGRLYFPGEAGVVAVVRAGPEFELLAENDIGEPILSTPAISRGQFIVRGQKHVFAFEAAN